MFRRSTKPKIIAFFLFVTILSASCLPLSVSGTSYEFPNAYWNLRSGFNSALESGNGNDIIKYGELIIECLRNEPLNKEIAGARAVVYKNLIDIYQQKEDYDKTRETLKEHIKCVTYLDSGDAIRLSTAKLESFNLDFEVYAESSDTSGVPFYNQKAEPENGIYLGRVFDYPDNGGLPIRESEGIVSFYFQFGTENLKNFDHFIRPHDDNTRMIHLAWNLSGENKDLDKVISSSSDSHIIDALTYVNSLESPTMLRIFAEMNVWQDLADAKKFKDAYIKIAKLARQYAPDTALVFAPNVISNWNVDISDYYPGDEYVDWVGVSLYSKKYASSSSPKVREDYNEAYYFNGIYQNPIIMLKDIVDRYGAKKPIIITEGGVAHSMKATSEDLTESSVKHINQVYKYVSMLFPQVKAAIYFDVNRPGSSYRYNLSINEKVKNAYFNAVSSNPASNANLTPSDTAYKPAGAFSEKTDTLNLSTYAVFPNYKQTTVEYHLDGKLHTAAKEIPYSANINTKSLSSGSHTLKVVIKNGAYSKTLNYTVSKSSNGVITCTVPASPTAASVLVDGKKVNFEAYNIDGSNYFKLRDLADVLNGTKKQFSVAWDDKNKAISLTGGKSYTRVGGELSKGGGVRKNATPTNAKVFFNNKEMKFTAYTIDGNNYFKLRDIGETLDFSVSWDSSKNTISIDTSKKYTN